MFPIGPGFYPIEFAQSSTVLYKIKRSNLRVDICFYFATGVQRGATIVGMPNVLKTFADGTINMPPLKKKLKKL